MFLSLGCSLAVVVFVGIEERAVRVAGRSTLQVALQENRPNDFQRSLPNSALFGLACV